MASFLASQSFHLNNIWHQFRYLIVFVCSLQLIACGSSRYISKQSKQLILSDSNFTTAHIGISIFDPSSNKYLYTHQAEKYFIPASNTKLFTCYAAMKYLGDSLVGLKYHNIYFYDSSRYVPLTFIKLTADPTFLHKDFKAHPVYDLFSSKKYWWIDIYKQGNFQAEVFGNGWAWNDYSEEYMPERSPFPIYGNVIRINTLPVKERTINGFDFRVFHTIPQYFDSLVNITSNEIALNYNDIYNPSPKYQLKREKSSNNFSLRPSSLTLPKEFYVPFTNSKKLLFSLLRDTVKTIFHHTNNYEISGFRISDLDTVKMWNTIHSQPTDSLLKPMMHRSDNFFAEQTLLMVSNEMTGIMNDAKIIDSLLKTDLKDLPQKPRWVDGSGLSRYNLFSPNDMVTVLNKMKNEFDWNRITTILPTGGEGTLNNYYLNLKDRIFAKTGTLSNNIALSGFLITKQNKTLIFSVLVNNHMGSTTQIRRAVEKFLTSVAEKN